MGRHDESKPPGAPHFLGGQPQHNLESALRDGANTEQLDLAEDSNPVALKTATLLEQNKEGFRAILRRHRVARSGSVAAMNMFESRLEAAQNGDEVSEAYQAYVNVNPLPRPSNWQSWFGFIFIVGGMGAGVWACGSAVFAPRSTSSVQSRGIPVERTPAQNLAMIAGLPADSPSIIGPLSELGSLCPEGQTMAGDIAAKMYNTFQQAGKNVSLPEVLSSLVVAQRDAGPAGFSCADTGGIILSSGLK